MVAITEKGMKIEPIVIEPEEPGNRLSLLRVLYGQAVRGEQLTAAQAHVLVGNLLEDLFANRPEED